MTDKIRVLIVDDIPETRENVRKLLQFEPDVDVVGYAASGEEAIELTRQHRPDVVLMDINMPDADGISASQTIINSVPGAQIIIMSVQSEADYLRKAMLAGARDFLMKPFSGDELIGAVRRVYETRRSFPSPATSRAAAEESAQQVKVPIREGKVVAVFSPKGGNGCTTLAVNVAVSLAEQGRKTLLLDASLQFGDVAVMLNLKSVTTIIDLVDHLQEMDQELISSVVLPHPSGLHVLLAPHRPEMAEMVRVEHVKPMLASLRQSYEYIIVDTASNLDDITLAFLDGADRILLVTRQDLPSLKNVSRFFDISESLEYDRSKMMLVVNHSTPKQSITVKDLEDTLKYPALSVIPEDEAAYSAADQGKPLVTGVWKRRPGARAIGQLTHQLVEELKRSNRAEAVHEANGASRLSRLFGK